MVERSRAVQCLGAAASLALALAALSASGCSGDGVRPRDAATGAGAGGAASTPPGGAPEPGATSLATQDPLALPQDHEVKVEVVMRNGETKRTFWVYRPEPTPARLGLVLMAPGGGSMLSGRALAPEDRAEHLPLVRAGLAVVAYSLDGDVAPGVSGTEGTRALTLWKASSAGLENARAALEVARERLPPVDEALVFALGRGAAGAHALLLAAEVPQLRGAVALGPVTQLSSEASTVMAVDAVIPGYAKLVRWSLPQNRVHDVRVPVLIFQGAGDAAVRPSETRAYVAALRGARRDVSYLESDGSDPEEGLLVALAWLLSRRDG